MLVFNVLKHVIDGECLQVMVWRSSLINPEPFLVCGRNYLLKMIHDVDFLGSVPALKDQFGFELGSKNPLCLLVEALYNDKKITSPGIGFYMESHY